MTRASIFWFTGLSGSGKTTVAERVAAALTAQGVRTLVLDGDDVRTRLHRHLGFTRPEIEENNRLIAELCQAERSAYEVILVPIISPFRSSRTAARRLLSPAFHEVYFSAPLEVVACRDVKGLYARASRSEIGNLIGVAPGIPYEPPLLPDLVVPSGVESIDASAARLLNFVRTTLRYVPRPTEAALSLGPERSPAGPFRRLALISHSRHFAHIGATDPDTLFVSCNWLVWQLGIREGRPCIHYELEYECPDATRASELYVRSHDWMYVGDRDATLFSGVSLGRKFVREVSQVILEIEHIDLCLTALIRRYRPEELIFIDFQTEISVLDAQSRLDIVARIADRHGLTLTERRDPVDPHDAMVPRRPYYGTASAGRPSRRSAMAFAAGALNFALGVVSRCVDRPLPRAKALLLLTQINSVPLLELDESRDPAPLLLADSPPNKRDWRFLLTNLRRGLRLIRSGREALDETELASIQTMAQTLTAYWSEGPDRLDPILRRYIEREILARGRLEDMAALTKRMRQVLNDEQPASILTDGLQNPAASILVELAAERGIRTAVTWHGQFIHPIKMDILGSDARFQGTAATFLSWGPANERWLSTIGATTRVARTGRMFARRLKHMSARQARPVDKANILLLQYAIPPNITPWPQAGQYAFIVKMVRALKVLGCQQVKIKLHPGTFKPEHYRLVLQSFGLECDVYRDEPFIDFVEWCDLAIGPAHSGAMIEVLAAGKPYFPVILEPHGVDLGYFEACSIYLSARSVADALAAGEMPDGRKILEQFASLGSGDDAAREVWHALRTPPPPPSEAMTTIAKPQVKMS